MNQLKIIIILISIISFIQISTCQKLPYESIDPYLGCRFCKTCGGEIYTFYGGKKHLDDSNQRNEWKYFGDKCSNEISKGEGPWELCCARDQKLSTPYGLCRFCATCGGEHKYMSGSRKTNVSKNVSNFTIYDASCGPIQQNRMNLNQNYFLCCTQKSEVSYCRQCNTGQVEGGMFIKKQTELEIADVNLQGVCGINDQYQNTVDDFSLCNKQSCPPEYVLYNNICLFNCKNKCKVCSSKTTCQECLPNYLLVNENCVLQCPKECETCTDSSPQSCLTCKPGQYLKQGQCYQNSIKNCEQCAFSDEKKITICKICLSNYKLSYSETECQPFCPDNCTKCTDPNICLECSSGYKKDQQNICIPLNCSNNCLQCDSPSTCTSCQQGFKLTTKDNNTYCTQYCSLNCDGCEPSNPQICKQCVSGYYLVSGECIQCSIPNCQLCAKEKDSVICKSCNSNYKVNPSQLTCESNCGANCKKCDKNICTDCNDKYKLNNSICEYEESSKSFQNSLTTSSIIMIFLMSIIL